MRFNCYWRIVVVTVTVLCGHVQVVSADFIRSSSQLQIDGTVTWDAFGPTGADFGSPQYTALPGITNTSLTVTGPEQAGGGFRRRDQGLGWNGSFNTGEEVIWSVLDGSFRIDFWNSVTGAPAPITGFGARYQDSQPGQFRGVLTGFDSSDNLLFSYQLGGSTQNGDPLGSAPFFGALSSERNISYLYYTDLTTGAPLGQQGFALGTLYVQSNPSPANPVPEPASILLFASGALGLLAARLKQTKGTTKSTSEVPV